MSAVFLLLGRWGALLFEGGDRRGSVVPEAHGEAAKRSRDEGESSAAVDLGGRLRPPVTSSHSFDDVDKKSAADCCLLSADQRRPRPAAWDDGSPRSR